MEFTFNGNRIDVHSQRIILGLKGGRIRGVQELARVAGWDVDEDRGARNKARHRLDKHLVPSGLVEVAGTARKQGGEATMYKLSEMGEEALAGELPHEFGVEPTVSTNAQRLDDHDDEIEALWARVEKNSRRIDDRATKQSLRRYEERYEDLADKSEKLIGEARQFRNSAWEAKEAIRENL